jgi:predicted nuclease of predicted toxin-antitoxin system
VRFLVDENLPRRFADLLRAAGHDASHVIEHDLAGAGAGDETVMALALDERAVLVTYDADFAAMLVLGELRFPSVVLFRDQHRRPEALAQLLLENLEQIEYSLTEGAIAIFDPACARSKSAGRTRVKALPLPPALATFRRHQHFRSRCFNKDRLSPATHGTSHRAHFRTPIAKAPHHQ